LAAYRELRHTLVEQLAVEPSATLQRLERAILSGAGVFEAYWPGRAATLAAAATSAAGAAAGSPAEPDQPDQPAPELQRARPALLPAAVAAFTGRTDYLKQLDALLADRTGELHAGVVISAITGTAGVGKTALAVHWAHQVRDRFPDGQLYVN